MALLDTSPSSVLTQNLLNPGEVIRTSGKFVKPTKIPGKNYSKDEVVIRNADSGKGKTPQSGKLRLFVKKIFIIGVLSSYIYNRSESDSVYFKLQ